MPGGGRTKGQAAAEPAPPARSLHEMVLEELGRVAPKPEDADGDEEMAQPEEDDCEDERERLRAELARMDQMVARLTKASEGDDDEELQQVLKKRVQQRDAVKAQLAELRPLHVRISTVSKEIEGLAAHKSQVEDARAALLQLADVKLKEINEAGEKLARLQADLDKLMASRRGQSQSPSPSRSASALGTSPRSPAQIAAELLASLPQGPAAEGFRAWMASTSEQQLRVPPAPPPPPRPSSSTHHEMQMALPVSPVPGTPAAGLQSPLSPQSSIPPGQPDPATRQNSQDVLEQTLAEGEDEFEDLASFAEEEVAAMSQVVGARTSTQLSPTQPVSLRSQYGMAPFRARRLAPHPYDQETAQATAQDAAERTPATQAVPDEELRARLAERLAPSSAA